MGSASNDVTYLFFRRDEAAEDNGPPSSSPVIKTTRVVRQTTGGGLYSRAGSVPPVPRRPLRAGSLPPGPLIRTVASTMTTTSGVGPLGGTSVRTLSRATTPALLQQRTSSTAVQRPKAASPVRLHSVPPPPQRPTAYRRASISVVPGPSRFNIGPSIYRADDFLSGLGPSSPVTIQSDSSNNRLSRSPAVSATSYRRGSVSVGRPSYWSSLEPVSPPPYSPRHPTDLIGNNVAQDGIKEYKVLVTTADKKSSSPVLDIKPVDFENHRESLSSLRSRTNAARDQLSRHRVLLDRYLPVNLAPPNDVKYEVEYKVSELFDRMPQLDPERKYRSSTKNDNNEKTTVLLVAPYRPPPRLPKVELPPVRTPFTPKISDVRKRARSVLCKVKGDPHYFDF